MDYDSLSDGPTAPFPTGTIPHQKELLYMGSLEERGAILEQHHSGSFLVILGPLGKCMPIGIAAFHGIPPAGVHHI